MDKPAAPAGRNDLLLHTLLDGEWVSHFRLREFENAEGLVMIHASIPPALERVRRDLAAHMGEPVRLIITDAVRTRTDLERLAARWGWADEGGLVSRRSKHLAEFGGIAVDLTACTERTRTRVAPEVLGRICRRYFDYVKDDYKDGHVHADHRDRAR